MRTVLALAFALLASLPRAGFAADPTAPTVINRSMSVIQAWNAPGVWANDFHIEFIARDLDGNTLDRADLDPFGFFSSLGASPLWDADPVTHRMWITWTFPLRCVPYPDAPAQFGFTVFGPVRFEVVDAYWTLNGARVQSNPDVWQDWITLPGLRQLQDVITPRELVPPPSPPPPLPVLAERTVSATPLPGLISIAELAATALPPDPVPLGSAPVVFEVPARTIDYTWGWPAGDATYFMYYDLLDGASLPVTSFRNAALMAREPYRATPPPAYDLSSDAFPPSDTGYASGDEISFAGGVLLRNLALSAAQSSAPLPRAAGGALIQPYTTQATFELSLDGGATWRPAAATSLETLSRAALDGGGAYSTEMLQLSISGGSLPPALRLRESPTLASRGRLNAVADGERYQIDSFFDVFLEVSADGGGTWAPASGPVALDLAPPPVVTQNRALNAVRVWTGQGVFANDFHIEFVARDAAGLRFLDLDDLDPTGYFDDGFVTNRIVTYNALSNRVSITWLFPDTCIPDASAPAFFGFTLFGGVRFQAVDWYWTYNGERIIAYQDVWQDWLKNPVTRRLEDTIIPRPLPVPPPPLPPTPVAFLSRRTGTTPIAMTLAEVVATPVPPNLVLPDPTPVPVTNLVPVTFDWAWPGGDPTYFMYYDLLDAAGEPIAGFQNAAVLTPQPEPGEPAPIEAPTDAFPTPDGGYSASGSLVTFGPDLEMANLGLTMVGPGSELPPPGDASLHRVEALMVFELSDGGVPLPPVRLQARPLLRVADDGAGGGGGARTLSTELVDLDCDPDPAFPGLRVRESPLLPSLGRSVIQPLPNGRFQIDSFFDVFLEVSVDNGNTWTPADAPARLALTPLMRPLTQVRLNRSLNTVRVWTPPGMVANDFHIEFVATVDSGFYLSLADLDPFGYIGTIATNRAVSFDPVASRVSITWQFPDQVVLTNAPAVFGFTSFGGIRYVAVDCYWTYNGARIWGYEDVWQDWIKFGGNLRDVIARREPVIPPPILPTPVRAVRRVVGRQLAPVSIGELAALALPPAPVWPDPGPVAFTPAVTNVVAEWAWPGTDPAYFVFYDLLDDAGAPVARFQNASVLSEVPQSAGETPQFAPTDLFPPPTLSYVEAGGAPAFVTYGGVRWTRDFTVRALSPDLPLPAPGGSSLATIPARVQFDVSSDGGSTWQTVCASADLTARIVATGLTDPFDAEILGLDLTPADLPGGLRLRESPSLPSLGRTTVTPAPGGYMIDSFFDVFLECSVDGGGTWLPADRAPRLAVQSLCAEAAAAESRFLPSDCYAAGRSPHFAFFPTLSLTDFTASHFTHACAWPTPGAARSHAFMGRASFNLNWPHGTVGVWTTFRAEAALAHQATDEGCDVYDAVLTRFDLYGGSLPDGLRLRLHGAGPGRSSGCATVRSDGGGGYRLCSFFDIWLEVSTDGGGTWSPALAPSGLNIASTEINGSPIEAWVDPVTQRALVIFSAPMGSSASDPDHYTFDGYVPASLKRLGDGRSVLATLANPPASPCQLVVQNIYDAEGGLMQPSYFAAEMQEGLIQDHDVAAAGLTIGQPDGPPERPGLRGSSVVLIEVPQSGQAFDSDGDSLDDAPARLLDVDLESADGRYRLLSSDQALAFGTAEELANPVAQHLDVPPFGNDQGVLHIGQFNFIVEIEGLAYTPETRLDLQGEFLDAYMAGGESLGWSVEPPYVPLLDGEGSPSGYTLGSLTLLPDVPSVSLSLAGGESSELRWPKPSPSFRVQRATSLAAQDWVTVDPGEYVDNGTYWSYPVTFSEASAFYRLILVEE
jgi:hypothetical protein